MDKKNSKKPRKPYEYCISRGGGAASEPLNQGFWAHRNQFSAFTMAEILISLTIIGVIAAITLPSLRANINETTWNTQRKALYSRMSQAISMLPSLNGYGIGATQEETNEKAAQAFVTDGLNKVFQINNICDSTKLKDCGVPEKIIAMGTNSKIDFPTKLSELNPVWAYEDNGNYAKSIDTNAAAFETKNGESVAVFYNPLCQADNGEKNMHYSQPKMCANFIYDLNGKKGPNKVGKDIGFVTALYPVDPSLVAPMPLEKNANNGNSMVQSLAASACRQQDENSRVPNLDELSAMFYNKQLIGISAGDVWSVSVVPSSNKVWTQYFNTGKRYDFDRTRPASVRCIKR